MKNFFITFTAALLLFGACTTDSSADYTVPEPQDVVMYQVNPRIFAPEKSFLAVTSHLDSIQRLGVNVVWFMPIYPVGEVNTVNSPYCIKDYKAINPEFGTMDDFKNLVAACHAKGMSVIVDWVANHTSWDNEWLQNKDWYTQDSLGQIIHPAGTNWADVADLNFDNAQMRQEMIDAMTYWVTEVGIDGFRCDAADFVPFDFWKQCCDALRSIEGHKLLLLAEGSRKDHFDAGFEMNYAWDYIATLRRIFRTSRGPAAPVSALFSADSAEYAGVPEGCVKLRFTTNHDESSNTSPIREFGGERAAMAAYVATTFIHGGALIYDSQEVGYPGRINFFHYVPMDWQENSHIYEEYVQLMHLYNTHAALRKGTLTPYPDSNVLAFQKEADGETFLVLVNLRQEDMMLDVPDGWQNKQVRNLMNDASLTLGSKISVRPFQYLILK